MCMSRITKIYDGKQTGFKTGYKVFYTIPSGENIGKPVFQYYKPTPQSKSRLVPICKLLTSPVNRKYYFGYIPGFHIYTSKKEAMRFVNTLSNNVEVWKVLYQKPLARGFQALKKVVVAKQMIVLEKVG